MSINRKKELEEKMAFARERAKVQKQNKEFYANKESATVDSESDEVDPPKEGDSSDKGDEDEDEDDKEQVSSESQPEESNTQDDKAEQEGANKDGSSLKGESDDDSKVDDGDSQSEEAVSAPKLNAEQFIYGKSNQQLYKNVASAENLANRLQVPAENVVEKDGLFGVKATAAQAHDLDPDFKPVK